jgi:hypothetical protein
MVVTIVILTALLIGAAASVWLVARDMRRLHRGHRTLADAQMSASGVSPGAMIAIGNNVTH